MILSLWNDERRCGTLEIFDVEKVGQFFEGAAGASGFWSAEFMADPYQQCMVFIEKRDVLRQIRLE